MKRCDYKNLSNVGCQMNNKAKTYVYLVSLLISRAQEEKDERKEGRKEERRDD